MTFSKKALPLLVVACALGVAALYVARQVSLGVELGFPLDDAYIYMTYAKQIARGHFFTYFDGGGFSAGSTSMLWPVVLAPFWAIGFRDHSLVYADLALCAALLAATAALSLKLGRRTLGVAGGLAASALVLTSGPLTFTYLAGMEVPLAGTLLLGAALALIAEGDAARPSPRLLVILGLAAIGRPEAGLLVAAVVGLRAAIGLARRDFPGALRWLAPLLAPAALAVVTRIGAGHFTPNTAVSKSHFHIPEFSLAYYVDTLEKTGRALADSLFWTGAKEVLLGGHGRLLAALWLVGAARLIAWGRRERRLWGVVLLVAAAPLVFLAVLLSSGQWEFQNYRYLASAFPALLVVAGVAVAPPPSLATRGRAFAIAGWAPAAGLAVFAAATGSGRMERDVQLFAQGTADVNAHTVRVGRWLAENLPPDSLVALHDVGATGYYGGTRFLDVIGLVTNGWAETCNLGPGARFEAFERIPPAERPSHFVYYPGWLLTGANDLFGRKLFEAPLAPALPGGGKNPERLIGGQTMVVFEARWDLLGSGEAPLVLEPRWKVIDTVDVADLPSEREHGYQAALGPRVFKAPTATWSVFFAAEADGRRIADGGRTIRGSGGERFRLRGGAGPQRLVVRVGGGARLPFSEVPAAPGKLSVSVNGKAAGTIAVPAPDGGFHDLILELPAGGAELDVAVTSAAPYRVFHWWVEGRG